jgi:heme/copper-type cytochrome/quinol oxidase subunit 2
MQQWLLKKLYHQSLSLMTMVVIVVIIIIVIVIANCRNLNKNTTVGDMDGDTVGI